MKKHAFKIASLIVLFSVFYLNLGENRSYANTEGYITEWVECPGKNVAVKRCRFGSGSCAAADQLFCSEIEIPGDSI